MRNLLLTLFALGVSCNACFANGVAIKDPQGVVKELNVSDGDGGTNQKVRLKLSATGVQLATSLAIYSSEYQRTLNGTKVSEDTFEFTGVDDGTWSVTLPSAPTAQPAS